MIKIAYFWTADFSAEVLRWLLEYKGLECSFVVSQEDKYVGRKKELKKTALKMLAEEKNIPVLQPSSLKNDTTIASARSDIDFFVVVAYGKIIPKRILDIPKHACINLHGSLLPLYRGASPVQAALKNGDTQTGLTTMHMSEWMDEWDMLLKHVIDLDPDMTQKDVFEKFQQIWPALLQKTIEGLLTNSIEAKAQDDLNATYCHKITKSDWLIDFNTSAESIYNYYRAYYGWPWIYGFFNWKKLDILRCHVDIWNEWVKVWEVLKFNEDKIWVVCADKKILVLQEIKLEWKKAMNILDFIRGNPDFIWYVFQDA